MKVLNIANTVNTCLCVSTCVCTVVYELPSEDHPDSLHSRSAVPRSEEKD